MLPSPAMNVRRRIRDLPRWMGRGQNLRIGVRCNAGDAALARTYAAQLIGLLPDVILTASTTNLTATSRCPQARFHQII